MDPELNEFIRLCKFVGVGEKKSLENIGHVSQVKLIVEVDGCFSEICSNSLMEGQGSSDDDSWVFLNVTFESLEMAIQEGNVNERKRLIIWERN